MNNGDEIIGICNGCADCQKAFTQKNLDNILALYDNLSEEGSGWAFYVKAGFEQTAEPELREFMWVELLTLDPENRTLIGTLANDPVYVDDYKYGDTLQMDYNEVYDVLIHQNGVAVDWADILQQRGQLELEVDCDVTTGCKGLSS